MKAVKNSRAKAPTKNAIDKARRFLASPEGSRLLKATVAEAKAEARELHKKYRIKNHQWFKTVNAAT